MGYAKACAQGSACSEGYIRYLHSYGLRPAHSQTQLLIALPAHIISIYAPPIHVRLLVIYLRCYPLFVVYAPLYFPFVH